MKKKLQKEFERIVRKDIGKFYMNAFTVMNDREDAEYLAISAIVWASEQFAALEDKSSVTDLIYQRIGIGCMREFRLSDIYPDEDKILARAMKRIRWKTKIRIGFPVLCGVVVAVILANLIL